MSNIKDWSSTPANNNQTPPLGWPEGMKASDVNNTARQDRADIRSWYVDAAWINPGGTPTYVSATQFTIDDDSEITDYSQYYSVARRIRITTGGNTVIAKITASTYSAPTTTVDFEVVSGTMTASISAVEYSIIQDNEALPDGAPVDPASETTQGIVFLATKAEAQAGTNDTDAMTPLKTKQLLEANSDSILPTNYITGMVPANNSVDSDHDIDFGVGEARDSSNTYVIDFDTVLTKQSDADWATGTNAGGMPSTTTETGTFTTSGTSVTGSGSLFTIEFEIGDILYSDSKSEGRRITAIGGNDAMTIESAFTTDVAVADDVKKNGLAPNSTYHLFVLYNSTTEATDAGFDTQLDASNLLANSAVTTAGFNKIRRVGSVITDSSANIVNGNWDEISGGGLRYRHFSKIRDITQTANASIQTPVMSVPLGIRVEGQFHASLIDASTGTIGITLWQTDEEEPTLSLITPDSAENTLIYGQTPQGFSQEEMSLVTDTLGQINWKATSTTANGTLLVMTLGYTDWRI